MQADKAGAIELTEARLILRISELRNKAQEANLNPMQIYLRSIRLSETTSFYRLGYRYC